MTSLDPHQNIGVYVAILTLDAAARSFVLCSFIQADTLQGVAAGIGIPFLESVCSICLNLIPMIEVLSRSLLSDCVPMLIPPESNHFQRDRCLRMTEEIHKSLCALGALCLGLEDTGPPEVLDQIAQYAR
ncbi:hypothetical protein C8F04DRAFT_1177330 [Mycena alexandri]|uniref:Uncharacterized protein n=1 Tax=Mycena alexandri TaxID=1745969 RepID=A0AAD6TB32_9AGAR|nr:hypothetical protein C8F04DRAFT_1177330 [Mycena alexandri]